MQLIIHVKGFFEWVEVPSDVDTKTAEFKRAIKAGKVKPVANGTWSMQVPKEADTQVMLNTSEDDVIQCIVQEMTRGDRRHLTRTEAVTRLVARHTLPHHAHKSHIEEVEVVDDSQGPDEKLFRKIIGEHIDCHNIDPLDFEGLLAAYLQPSTPDDNVMHLHSHFEVKPAKVEAFRAKRLEREETMRAARAHQISTIESADTQKDDEVDS